MSQNNAVYVAGPMTGFHEFNFPAFDEAEEFLNEKGFTTVFNPAEHDRWLLKKPQGWLPTDEDHDGEWKRWKIEGAPSLRDMLGADLNWIAKNATHIYMLKGWERSSGAKVEHALAVALGLEIIYQ